MTKREEIREMRNRLYAMEIEYELKPGYNQQSIRIRQRISALLDIYGQILDSDRVFDEEYLKNYM